MICYTYRIMFKLTFVEKFYCHVYSTFSDMAFIFIAEEEMKMYPDI